MYLDEGWIIVIMFSMVFLKALATLFDYENEIYSDSKEDSID